MTVDDGLIQDSALGGFLGENEPIGGFKDRPSRPSPDEGYLLRIRVRLREAAITTVGPPKVPKSHDDTLDDTLELRILSLIKKRPRINQRELSQQLEVSIPTIKRAMSDMVEKGMLERKGGKRYGHWELKAR